MNLDTNTVLQIASIILFVVYFGVIAFTPQLSLKLADKIVDMLNVERFGGLHYTIFMLIGLAFALIGISLLFFIR